MSTRQKGTSTCTSTKTVVAAYFKKDSKERYHRNIESNRFETFEHIGRNANEHEQGFCNNTNYKRKAIFEAGKY